MEGVFDQRHRRRYLMIAVVFAMLAALGSCVFVSVAHARCSAPAVLLNDAKVKPVAA